MNSLDPTEKSASLKEQPSPSLSHHLGHPPQLSSLPDTLITGAGKLEGLTGRQVLLVFVSVVHALSSDITLRYCSGFLVSTLLVTLDQTIVYPPSKVTTYSRR